jgi:hypothetical protein
MNHTNRQRVLTATKDIVVFKAVRKEGTEYMSQYSPYNRSGNTKTNGKDFIYPLGKFITSSFDTTLGIHVFTTKTRATSTWYNVLRLVIPKGTRYRRGYSDVGYSDVGYLIFDGIVAEKVYIDKVMT